MSKRHKTLSREQHVQVLQKLWRVETPEEAVLRGHLYVEYWLNELTLRKLKRGDIIVSKFSFSQKVDIAEAAEMSDEPDFFPCLRQLNSIRNRLAHDLYPEDLAILFDELTVPFQEGKDTRNLPTGLHKFVFAVEIVSVYMLGACESTDGTEQSDSLLPAFLRP